MLNNNQGKILLATFLLLTASFVAINPNLDKIFTTNNAVYAERDDSSITESETKQLDEKIVNANRNFAFKLFYAIREEDETENVFISAPSISIALNLLNNGADGDTREEIKQVLELQEISLPEINQQYKILQHYCKIKKKAPFLLIILFGFERVFLLSQTF